jgi:hypothetical protein
MGSHLYGTSKIQSAYAQLMTYLEATNREYTGFKTGDSAHILFPKSIESQIEAQNDPGLLQKFKDAIFRSLRQKDRHQAAVIGQEIGHINLASALKDSNSLEVKREIKNAIASVFHMSSKVVFNDASSASYNNIVEDKKSTLQNGVFPFLNQLENILSEQMVRPEFGLLMAFDYDVYPELNPETLTEMSKMKDVDFLSDNEKRKWFDFEPLNVYGSDLPTKYNAMIEPINVDYGKDNL